MDPINLIWICPLCVVCGVLLTAVCASAWDADEIIEAKKADENPEPIPAVKIGPVDIDYYVEGRRPSGLTEED